MTPRQKRFVLAGVVQRTMRALRDQIEAGEGGVFGVHLDVGVRHGVAELRHAHRPRSAKG